MIKNMRLFIPALMLLIFTSVQFAAPALVSACGDATSANSARGQVLQGVGESGTDCDASGVTSLITTIVSIISFIAGAVAVIMIVLSGMRFITSGGDSQKVASARSSLLYAVIGLAILALTQVIIHFALNTTKSATTKAAGVIEVMKP
jgi:hypothetical protein